MLVPVTRKDIEFLPDASRVIARFHDVGDERNANIIRRVLRMPEENVKLALNQVLREYSKRHRNISTILEKNFNKLNPLFKIMNIIPENLDSSLRLLIGSYFTKEYSIESAAFFNPSIVEHPDQTELNSGEKRVILSFRATGEGHISSLVFRTGVLDNNNDLTIEPAGKMLDEANCIQKIITGNDSFLDKLKEMKPYPNIKWDASLYYDIEFSLDTAISERVIFPISEAEKNGIEDARFVKFTDDDGEITYYAIYTAYNGKDIYLRLLETKDFYHFKISPLLGEIAENKGMALFPRKINGKYALLCRIDGENNYISFSDNINVWREAKIIQEPKYSWEFMQIGNCGSPIETEDGWLVITHAVGPMREYVLSASLYDINNPEKEIGRLSAPLISPNKREREGYVPNVVYSCGSMLQNDDLIIPYAMSDFASTYASVKIKDLLAELKSSK
jgi:predicted GH43/DUF377 family glycosyl hydrolase